MTNTAELLDAVSDWAAHEHAAQRLSQGEFLAVAGESLPADTDVHAWTARVVELCQQQRTTVEYVAHSEANVTIVMNTAAMPTLDQIESALAAIEYRRSVA